MIEIFYQSVAKDTSKNGSLWLLITWVSIPVFENSRKELRVAQFPCDLCTGGSKIYLNCASHFSRKFNIFPNLGKIVVFPTGEKIEIFGNILNFSENQVPCVESLIYFDFWTFLCTHASRTRFEKRNHHIYNIIWNVINSL